jgi:hypothetical protein
MHKLLRLLDDMEILVTHLLFSIENVVAVKVTVAVPNVDAVESVLEKCATTREKCQFCEHPQVNCAFTLVGTFCPFFFLLFFLFLFLFFQCTCFFFFV